jgi:hypothetical protein
MTPHATHPGLYDETCPDCAGYPDEPEEHGRRWRATGLVLELFSAFLVIAFLAVIVRLAVSR